MTDKRWAAERNLDLIRKERDEAVWAMAALRKALSECITQQELEAALPRLWDHPDSIVADAYENGGWGMVAAAIFECVRRPGGTR
jgi:hypothetical protein